MYFRYFLIVMKTIFEESVFQLNLIILLKNKTLKNVAYAQENIFFFIRRTIGPFLE